MAGETPFEEALNSARRSAVHLEMRDVYLPDDPDFAAWRAGQFEPGEQWQWWVGLVRAAVARGVEIRRARVVSEPVSEYIRFEHAITADLNVAAGGTSPVATEAARVRPGAAGQRLLALRRPIDHLQPLRR